MLYFSKFFCDFAGEGLDVTAAALNYCDFASVELYLCGDFITLFRWMKFVEGGTLGLTGVTCCYFFCFNIVDTDGVVALIFRGYFFPFFANFNCSD